MNWNSNILIIIIIIIIITFIVVVDNMESMMQKQKSVSTRSFRRKQSDMQSQDDLMNHDHFLTIEVR